MSTLDHVRASFEEAADALREFLADGESPAEIIHVTIEAVERELFPENYGFDVGAGSVAGSAPR